MATRKARKTTKKSTNKKTKAVRRPARTKAVRQRGARPQRGPSSGSGAAAAVGDAPQLFRLNVEVGDIAKAMEFYSALLGQRGRPDRGARCYFDCGPVTLQIVDTSASGTPHTAAKALYFVTGDLDAVFVRARELGCLSPDDVHGEPAGNIAVRPWGERSFYAEDPWGNPLCFVAAGTIYRA